MSIEAYGNSQAMHRTGWVLSGIVIAFMAADAMVSISTIILVMFVASVIVAAIVWREQRERARH